MKCPYCAYSDGEYDFEMDGVTRGDAGPFYTLPVEMTRKLEYTYALDRKELHACPSCNKTFID